VTPAERIPLQFPATPRHCELALRDLTKLLADAGLPRKACYNAEVVFEEVVTNIVRPCEYPEPEYFSSVMSAKLGGLGISLVRKASTSMTYERTPKGENRLTVTVAAR
jgi:anti-sigma regulatory factor (Ser/Thr protein kinase)